MRAALLEEFNRPLSLVDLSVDEPMAGEVLVRVVASGVCHSDHNLYVGNMPATPRPQVLGHEVAGIVEAVGPDVPGFSVGEHVVTCPSSFCGECVWCMRGQLHLCLDKRRSRLDGQVPRLTFEGEPVAQFAGLGGFAELMLVHHRAVAAIPKEMPMDRACLLGCAVVTGMGSVLNAARVRPGETVAVLGCGGVGLNAIQAARLSGASRIIAIDRFAAKLDRALEFGATDVVNGAESDALAAVRELTAGGVDHAFEAVGRAETIEQAFRMTGLRGTTTVIGVARTGTKVSIDALDLLGERRLQGAQMGSSRYRLDVALFAQMYLDGRIKLDELISRRIELADVTKALDDLEDFTGARSVITLDP